MIEQTIAAQDPENVATKAELSLLQEKLKKLEEDHQKLFKLLGASVKADSM